MASRNSKRNFCIKMLKGVRFRPTGSPRDAHYSGIHSTGLGLGGLGVSYWLSYDIIDVERNVGLIRELCKQKELSLTECHDVVRKFIELEFHPIIAGDFVIQINGTDLFAVIDDAQLDRILSNAITFFRNFFTERDYWIPLNSIQSVQFDGENFSIVSEPTDSKGPITRYGDIFNMPILKSVTAWLRVRARSVADAIEKSSVILGAFFLCMDHNTHYSHTMGKPAEGILNFDKGANFSSSSAHVPYLAYPIEFVDLDLIWLKSLDSALSKRMEKRKFLRSLRWLHASWFAKGAEQFSLICMSVDAITPSKFNTSMAKSGWIRDNLGVEIDSDAIELIFKRMRADVAHGDAPSLIESQAYLDFIEKYAEDPSKCAVAIACRIIQRVHLPNMRLQPHPLTKYPEIIARKKKIMSRFDLPFRISAGFDFQRLRTKDTRPEIDSAISRVDYLKKVWHCVKVRLGLSMPMR